MKNKIEGNLKETIVKVEGSISLCSLKVALPCQRFLKAGNTCGKDTNYAVVVERMDYFLVIPMCERHLPDWAKSALKEKGARAKEVTAKKKSVKGRRIK